MAMPAGAFVSEIAGINSIAFGDESYFVGGGDFAAVRRFAPAVPNAENDPALGRTIDLHAEIAAMPAARHVKSPQWIFNGRNFAIKSLDVGVALRGIEQMDRSGIAPFFQIEMSALRRRPVEDKRFQVARLLPF